MVIGNQSPYRNIRALWELSTWKRGSTKNNSSPNMASCSNLAVLRCVNGSWFCPTCFISCSTKGNLKRHIANAHVDNSSVESYEESTSKFIFLDRNDCNTTSATVEDPDTDDGLEHDFDLEEGNKLTEPPEERADEESDFLKFPVTDIDTLYARLSEEYANTKKTEQTTSRQEVDDCDSTSEIESSASDDSIIWSLDEETEDEDSDDNKEDRPIFEGSNVTYEEHLMAIMALATRHNLNQAQLSDVIEVIKLHSPNGDVCISSMKALYSEVTGDVEMTYHDVCEDCYGLFPEDSSVYRCATSGCSG